MERQTPRLTVVPKRKSKRFSTPPKESHDDVQLAALNHEHDVLFGGSGQPADDTLH